MIEAVDLGKQFGSFQAVRSVSLHVAQGEVVALLGPNGAGKTTTVRMLAAILKPSRGRALVGGFDVSTHAREVRHEVGLLTEFPGLYHRMRPLEYLEFFGALQGLTARVSRERGEALLRRFELWQARDKRLDSFSKGMKQKIALIRALIHDPPVLFLDEPTTAMDPHSARIVRDAMLEMRAARKTILLTTHNLTEAEELADRIVIVRGGGIVAEGTRAELTRDLLGDPVWEIRLAYPDDRLEALVGSVAPVVAVGENWVQYRCAEPQHFNPALLARCHAAALPVLALAEQPRSLEQVYLSIVAEQTERVGDLRYAAEPELEEAHP